MPENWKTYKLGDLISIRGGFRTKEKKLALEIPYYLEWAVFLIVKGF